MDTLVTASENEQRNQQTGSDAPSTKLLAHLLDLAFEQIPADPACTRYRLGHTLGKGYSHWFRAKTGNGRYRLFYRYSSAEKIIILGWVNDEQSLRTYGSSTDAYSTFRQHLKAGHPPDDWASLKQGASEANATEGLTQLHTNRPRTRPSKRTRR